MKVYQRYITTTNKWLKKHHLSHRPQKNPPRSSRGRLNRLSNYIHRVVDLLFITEDILVISSYYERLTFTNTHH